MNFRLHAIVALAGAILLLPLAARAQQQPAQPPAQQPAGQQPSSGQDALAPGQQTTGPQSIGKPPATPIEPVMGGPYPVMSHAAEDRARQIFEMFNHSDFSAMWAALSEGRKRQVKEEKRFIEGNKKYRERLGNETEVRAENIVPNLFAPDTVYSRLSTFSNVRVPLAFTITINQLGQIDDFDFKLIPENIAEGKYAGYDDVAKLKLPFNGEWLVYQGGRNVFDNPYAINEDQRFGLDFAYLKNGRLFSGPGGSRAKNSDYYCFGQAVLAPFDGTVSRAVAGYDDAPPGKPTGDPSDGNLVVITHEEGDTHESVLMNHLKQNSLKVKRGDQVKTGDVLAECGNSGAGPVPHLHFQLEKSAGTPLPAQFKDYIADGKPVASGEPVRGQFVKNGTAMQTNSVTTSSGNAKIMTATPAAGSGNNTAPPQSPSH
jgi:murein DD-endopeptidase MepM/ murein hydrolase activator NlpD